MWDVRPHEAVLGGVACARFDALMDTHRGDRLEIWTHFGFLPDGRLVALMASRNRDEPGSEAVLDRILGGIRFPEGAWTTWRDEPTGAGGLRPARWSVRREESTGGWTIRPTALPRSTRDASFTWSSREATGHGPDRHRDACYEVRQALGLAAPVGESEPLALGAADALSTWIAADRLRVRVVTLEGDLRIHRLVLRLAGSPADPMLRSEEHALERVLLTFEPR